MEQAIFEWFIWTFELQSHIIVISRENIRLEEKRKLFKMSPSLTSHEYRVQPWLNYPYELEINGSICWFIYFASFVSFIGWLSYSCSACAAVVYRSLLDRIFCPAASIHTDLHRHVSGSLMSFNSIESTCKVMVARKPYQSSKWFSCLRK